LKTEDYSRFGISVNDNGAYAISS